ncbi:DNA-directed DNA polymerase alpha subunit pol12 [Coemansia sp. RSA 988]|nr:DNA-directed DNA polymerase alpha subunit pol12 [Coemansia sp. RSA 988]
MSTPTQAQLQNEFGNAALAPDALSECQSMCTTFGLAASELLIRWQTFVINQHGGDVNVKPTRERLLEVRAILQQENMRRASQRPSAQPRSATKLSRNKDRAHYDKSSVGGLLQGMVAGSQREPVTPQSTRRVGLLRNTAAASPLSPSVFAEPSPSAVRYSSRTNTGRTEAALHASLPPLQLPHDRSALVITDLCSASGGAGADSESSGEEEDKTDNAAAPRPTRRMRYMFERLGARADTVNRRIERMAADVKAEYAIDALANPTYPHQDTVTAVGRIVGIDMDGSGAAAIGGDTLFLETSRRLGGGRRVALDVHGAASFSLFPGQVVVAEGKNLKGTEFAVSRFRTLPCLRKHSDDYCANPIAPFDAIVAAGPYTLDDNLDFEPLRDLVEHVIAARPSLVLLLGPFISETHPLLRAGRSDLTPEELFAARISPMLERLQETLPFSTVRLVPAADDLCSPFAAFPQPPLAREQLTRLGVPRAVESLANPVQLTVNGVAVAVANTDALAPLARAEVSRLPALSDRLPRLAWHLIEQRHFCPLATPPGAILAAHDAQLRMHTMPDIFVTPSYLRPFAHVHDGVVLLNPGHASKGLSGGTFARIAVRAPTPIPAPDSTATLTGHTPLLPAERTSVEIVRI